LRNALEPCVRCFPRKPFIGESRRLYSDSSISAACNGARSIGRTRLLETKTIQFEGWRERLSAEFGSLARKGARLLVKSMLKACGFNLLNRAPPRSSSLNVTAAAIAHVVDAAARASIVVAAADTLADA